MKTPAWGWRLRSDAGSGPVRGTGRAWTVAAAVSAVMALTAALLYAGAGYWADSGGLIGWVLPLARTIHHVSLAAVLGALLFASLILPQDPALLRVRVQGIARCGAVTWLAAAMVVLAVRYADDGESAPPGEAAPSGLADFAVSAAVGRVWLAVVVIAAAVTALTFLARLSAAAALAGLFMAAAAVPLSLMGPAAAGENVNAGIDAMLLHVSGAGVWVGGILVLALISGPLSAASRERAGLMVTVLRRFSVLAGCGCLLVLGSGVLGAVLHLDGLTRLFSPYGVLLVAKTAAALGLGAAAFLYRRQAVRRLAGGAVVRNVLWTMTGVELLVLGAVSGISVALGRMSALVEQEPRPDTGGTRLVTGYEMPPPLEAAGWLTQWRVDWTWAVFAAVAAVAYLSGVRRLAARSIPWPPHRTVCWLAGLAVLLYITCGAAAIYRPVLFSVHAGAHLALAFVVSLLLVAATPLVLLSETVPPRGDGSLGAADIASAVARARRRWLSHPVVCSGLLVGSFIGFYYSPAFRQVLQGHVAHEVVEVFFILLGICFYHSVLQPGRTQGRADIRAPIAAATAGVFCLWTAWLAFSTEPIAADWFSSLGRDWGPGPLTDQQNTALAVWLIAALPSFLAAAWVAVRGGLAPRPNDGKAG